MTSSRISLIIPLPEAAGNRRVGAKAANLAKLIEARFAVPRGFVVSADAYRSHLWSSGVRTAASADAGPEACEQVRSAILSTAFPEDLQLGLEQAYERLSWQLGIADPAVAVRASSLEEDCDGNDFPDVYESVLDVRGVDEIKAAILRVWASLWSDRAADYREKCKATAEPAMAVIVQHMISADVAGMAYSADPATGDPHCVHIISRQDGEADYTCSIDLNGRPASCESKRDEIINIAAEKAILIEDVIPGPIEIEWAHDSVGMWILQARHINELPEFTGSNPSLENWQLALEVPICAFSREMLRGLSWVRIENGYPYIRIEDASSDDLEKDIRAAASDLKKWQQESAERVRTQAQRVLRLNVSELNLIELQVNLAQTARAATSSLENYGLARRHCAITLRALKEILPDSIPLFDLIDGLDDSVTERDARVQELGERISVAEVCGRLEDEAWIAAYKQTAREFALNYGGTFGKTGDMFDISCWKNWLEDSEAVYRIVGALDAHELPSLLPAHCAAVRRAEELISSSPSFKKKKFAATLAAARGWLIARDDIELACAQSLAAVRLLLLEIGKKLHAASILAQESDVFVLTLDDILALTADISESDLKTIASTIASRKHDLWLEGRLTANSEASVESALDDRALAGIPSSPGTAAGKARLASTITEAGEIREGEILIIANDGLAWTPFLGAAAGVIVESGNEFSAIARIARECGIPAVMNCLGIVSAVREGGRVTIDGSTGNVQFFPGASWE